MNHLHWLPPALTAILICLLFLFTLGTSTPASARSTQSSIVNVRIELSMTDVPTLTGDSFTINSTFTNDNSEMTPPLIANLAFVSVDHNTYVDPEDWSPQRTATIGPIAPGASVTRTWTINTVLAGEVAAYVVVLPDAKQFGETTLLSTSPALYMHVSEQRKLNPGGVLPIVVAVPGLIAVAFTGLQISRRRR